MPSNDDFMTIARKIVDHMNIYRLAFKTFHINDLNSMITDIAGEGAKVNTKEVPNAFEMALLNCGFIIYPSFSDTRDGYIRIIRANSIVGNLLNAFRYVGPNGDAQLAKLLNQIKRRPTNDDFLGELDESL